MVGMVESSRKLYRQTVLEKHYVIVGEFYISHTILQSGAELDIAA